jgi:hypothetical protein
MINEGTLNGGSSLIVKDNLMRGTLLIFVHVTCAIFSEDMFSDIPHYSTDR